MSRFGTSERGDDVVRSFGHMEGFQAGMHAMELYTSVVISCRYTVPPDSRTQARSILERAIAHVVLEHPLLRVRVMDSDSKKPYWARVDNVDLNRHIEWHELDMEDSDVDRFESKLQETIRPHIYSRWTDLAERPGWKVHVLRAKGGAWAEVVYTWNHAHGDGSSGKIFHKTLLRHLQNTSTAEGKDHEAVNPDEDLKLNKGILEVPRLSEANFTKPQERLMKFPVSIRWALPAVWHEVIRPKIRPTKPAVTDATWAPTRVAKSDLPPKSSWGRFTIDPPAAAKILAQCREHKTTLTGLLHALALIVFCAQIPEGQARGFHSESAISLRRFVKPQEKALDPEMTMGNFITQAEHKFGPEQVQKIRQQLTAGSEPEKAGSEAINKNADPASADLDTMMWQAATDVRHQLKEKLDMGTKNDTVGLMGVIDDWRDFWREEMKKGRKSAWYVTNLGTIDETDPTSQDVWSMSQATFTQCALVCGAALLFSVIGIKYGGVTISYTWQEGVLSDELVFRIVQDLQHRLDSLSEGNSIGLLSNVVP